MKFDLIALVTVPHSSPVAPQVLEQGVVVLAYSAVSWSVEGFVVVSACLDEVESAQAELLDEEEVALEELLDVQEDDLQQRQLDSDVASFASALPAAAEL